jgi:2-polyprenyl-3-methyl-5-hydroxy-6-metoxy-1,4-benzoquinol methylase
MKCRHCDSDLLISFMDLGSAPPSNAYLTKESLNQPEKWYPLRVQVCSGCWLVQTEDFADATELFDADYAYFSSYSTTMLSHVEQYVSDMTKRFGLNTHSHVVEVAANDGYLLQYFKQRDIPCLGVEPTNSTANAAREKGIEIVEKFFGVSLANRLVEEGQQADLTVANNVLAHVPDINDFVSGFSILLKAQGVATFEFPHLLKLVAQNQFDTIYHEHFSYLSLITVIQIFEKNGLDVFDVEEIATHGGSIRVFAQRNDTGSQERSLRVSELIERELKQGMNTAEYYTNFQILADKVKNELLNFLIDTKKQGKKVVAYGAAAKGNTMLNYAGVRPDLLPFVVDRNPAKEGKFLAGSRIPIVSEKKLKIFRPDYIIILPWNLREEVMHQLAYVKEWDGKFVTAIPLLEIQ